MELGFSPSIQLVGCLPRGAERSVRLAVPCEGVWLMCHLLLVSLAVRAVSMEFEDKPPQNVVPPSREP